MYNWRLENRETYYSKLEDWWTEHNFPIVSKQSLPTRIFIAYDNNFNDVLAIPVYATDSDFCYLGFITMNPKATITDKKEVMPWLMEIVKTAMKYQGYQRFLITCAETGLQKQLVRSGFNFLNETKYYHLNL